MTDLAEAAAGLRRRTFVLAAAALAAGLLIGALVMGTMRIGELFGRSPDPESVVSASLQSMQEQARLTPLAARFVAVVTSTQSRFGLSARKTLIMPGLVRYEVDLAKLGRDDLAWDPDARRLAVTLPPLEISQPQIALDEMQEYDEGGLLMRLTDAEERLDAANRARAQQELIRQARQPVPMRLAKDAARRAVARSFALPLQAAGVEAEIAVRFADDPSGEPSYLDRSRRIADVLREQEAAAR